MAKRKSCQIGSSTLGLGLCLVMFGCTLILVPVIVGNPVEVKKRSLDICKDVSCPPGQHCCEDRDRCGGNECEECVDGTFSPGGDAICENCNQCEIGTKKLENCTRAKDTVCSNCSAGNFRSSSGRCVPCTSCNGEPHCFDICTTTPMKTTLSMSTISSRPHSVTTLHTTFPSTTRKGKTVMPSTITSTTMQDRLPLENSWMESTGKYLLPLLAIFFFIVIAVGCLCYWEKLKDFWSEQCAQYINVSSNEDLPAKDPNNGIDVSSNEDLPAKDPNNGIEMDKVESQKNAGETSKRVEEQPHAPKKQVEPKNNNPSLSFQPQAASSQKTRRNSYRRTSLSTLPEDEPLLHNQDMSSNLPDWCLKDKTRVTMDIAGSIATYIGKKGAFLGQALGLHKGTIENFENDHKDDLARQNLEIIEKWITTNGVKATKCKLAQALVKVERSDVANLLWPDRKLSPVTPTTPLEDLHFWQRRGSTDNIKFDTSVIDKMDLTKRQSWCQIIKDAKDNDFGGLEELRIACDILALKLPKLNSLTQCHRLSDFEVDIFGNLQIKNLGKFTHLTAVKVTVNGNCLFSSVSILVSGCEDRCTELRLRTVIELIKNKNYYLKLQELNNCIKYEYALTNTEEDDGLSDHEIEAHFDGSVRDTLKDGEPVISLQGNSIQLFGLASVLGCNIQSVYPSSVSSPLNILIQPRNKSIENPVTAHIMWSMHEGLSEEENFIPNHFVPLLEE